MRRRQVVTSDGFVATTYFERSSLQETVYRGRTILFRSASCQLGFKHVQVACAFLI